MPPARSRDARLLVTAAWLREKPPAASLSWLAVPVLVVLGGLGTSLRLAADGTGEAGLLRFLLQGVTAASVGEPAAASGCAAA